MCCLGFLSYLVQLYALSYPIILFPFCSSYHVSLLKSKSCNKGQINVNRIKKQMWPVFSFFLTKDLASLANPWQPSFQDNPGSLWHTLSSSAGNALGMPVVLHILYFVRLLAIKLIIRAIHANNVSGNGRKRLKQFQNHEQNVCRKLHRVRHCFSDLLVFPHVVGVFFFMTLEEMVGSHSSTVCWTDATRWLSSVWPKNGSWRPQLADCAFWRVKTQPGEKISSRTRKNRLWL